ncbi:MULTISPECIES: GntR family transcriptional regulator [Arthrobacter]|uniref:GntR family transcriptional regulator n=1 Tax=unclassified Arthrobacter TaxID=235627 RepID=UPI0024B954B0|nr:GntR family transcriptional regulator [Arthrobacter sp. H35-MC1]MDJ0317001.1 GntR family transcriptional regulator [Arthrobacter sp. H35-MC1]
MEARIVIDLQTATPPYEQVQRQIASLIAVGELQIGTRLPTIRSLAGDLGVAAGTVARAYKELEAAGQVTTNRRQGTVVAGTGVAQTQPQKPHHPPEVSNGLAVLAAVEHLIQTSEEAGLDAKTLISLVQGQLNRRGSQ